MYVLRQKNIINEQDDYHQMERKRGDIFEDYTFL